MVTFCHISSSSHALQFPAPFHTHFSVDRAHVRTGIPTHYSRSGHITTENARRVFGGWGCLCRAKPISANENTILSTCEPGSRRTPHNICERVRVESVDRWRTSAQRYGPCVCVCVRAWNKERNCEAMETYANPLIWPLELHFCGRHWLERRVVCIAPPPSRI